MALLNNIKALFDRGYKRHKKLEDRIIHAEEDEVEFQVRYLGETPISESNSKKSTAQAVKNAVQLAKRDKEKLKKVTLTIGPGGIRINEYSSYCMLEIPLSHISYCSADGKFSDVFAFISINTRGDLKCYCFMCSSGKEAKEISVSLNKMFQSMLVNMKIEKNTF